MAVQTRSIPCEHCAEKKQQLELQGLRVLGCDADPSDPGFCTIRFEDGDSQAPMAASGGVHAAIASNTPHVDALGIQDHWLVGKAVSRRETPNQSGAITPEYLVMHYTAGRSAASSVEHFQSPAANASAHLVIGRDGLVTQLVPFNKKAWHAGVSSWAGRDGVNAFSVGVELDNAGKLQKVGESFQAWFGGQFPLDQVVSAKHKNEAEPAWWHVYTAPQIDAAIQVGQLLVRTYGLRDVVGHEDIAPGRKVDPGPAFPMASFRSLLFGRGDDAPPAFEVTVDALNVRAGPGTEFAVTRSPLKRGTLLNAIEMRSLWSHVRVADGMGQDGWVRNAFIRQTA